MKKHGFTIIEVSIASTIMVVVVSLSIGSFVYLMKSVHENAVQDELDLDVQKAMERLKHDIRLSSVDGMVFHPQGAGPYTAISFPLGDDRDGDGGLDVEDGKIKWWKTVVYHVYPTHPHQLRRTIFDPRDNDMEEGERIAQLASVVENGDGRAADNSEAARTETIFQNLFTWSITPKGAVFDGYAENLERQRVTLGTCILGPESQSHTFEFKLTGKNVENTVATGFKLGIDQLFVTPSYGAREAEALLVDGNIGGSLAAFSGPTPYSQRLPGSTWSGNRHLSFPATAQGQYIQLSLHNDAWEDTNFDQAGARFENTDVIFDESCYPEDFVVVLEGNDYCWESVSQTGDYGGYAITNDLHKGAAVRVQIRGGEMAAGNWIIYNGGNAKFLFKAGGTTNTAAGVPPAKLVIAAAYVAESADGLTPGMDIKPGTAQKLSFFKDGTYWGSSVSIEPGHSVWAIRMGDPYVISRDKSYTVCFLVQNADGAGNPYVWDEKYVPGLAGSFYIPGDYMPVETDLVDPVWSNRTNVVSWPGVVSVQAMFTSYPANGTYTSPAFDTHLEAPVYSRIGWHADCSEDSWVSLKVRTGDSPEMTNALDWASIESLTQPDEIFLQSRRYVQYQAELHPDNVWWGEVTPRLKDVTIKWTGATRAVDIGGVFTRGPDYGVFEVKVDGVLPRKALSIDLEIFKDIRGVAGTKRVTSFLRSEVDPRNSGR